MKSKPASKYELGKFQLELMAYIMSEKTKGERAGDSGFRVDRFLVEEVDGKLSFVVRLEGKAKNMNEAQCIALNDAAKSNDTIMDIPKNIWPGLTDHQYSRLSKEIVISTELISKENASFKVRC